MLGHHPMLRHQLQKNGRRAFAKVRAACEFVERYRDISDAIVFVLDQDCEDGHDGRRNKRVRIENAVRKCDPEFAASTVVLAIQELEVWAIWGSREALGIPWDTIRAECHPKEVYFEAKRATSCSISISISMRWRTPGRWTFTATSSPLCSTAR